MATLSDFCHSQPRSQYNFAPSPPSTHSFSYTLLFVFAFVSLCIAPALAGPNVTVDDTDSRIVYTGFWERTPNFEEFSTGGGHVTTFNDPTASVTFAFQGTAVYLAYPLWPYQVSSGWISLDGQAPVRVSLQDPNYLESDGGRATTPSSIRYIAEGLDPGVEHTIRVMAAPAEEFVVFDMIMYTLAEPGDTVTIRPTGTETAVTTFVPDQSNTNTRPTLSSNPSPTISSPSFSTSPIARSNASTSPAPQSGAQSQTQTITIAVCVVAAILFLLAIPLTFLFCKRRRQQKERDQWTQEALNDYNAAYPKPAEAAYSNTPIHTALTTVPKTPQTYASFGSYGNVGYVVPSPTALDPTYLRRGSRDGLENDGYMEQIRRNHSQMVAAKSSMGSVAVPATPPTAAGNTVGRGTQPQPWGREHEFVVPMARRHPSARPRRQQSGDSGLSYVTETPNFPPVPQATQAATSAADLHSQAVEARDQERERELELEAERQEREHRQRLKLRIRNARSTMMTVNTVSLPPAYDDPSYAPPPPIPQQPETRRPQAYPSPSSKADGPSHRSPQRSRQYQLPRMTKVSTLHNPWDDAYGGMGQSVEDDFDGRTLVDTTPIRDTAARGSGLYAKTRLHTLAPASENN